jgi:hypothetical protein
VQSFCKTFGFHNFVEMAKVKEAKGEEKVMTESSGGAPRKVTNEVPPVIPLDEKLHRRR